jgi:hypothetical protein
MCLTVIPLKGSFHEKLSRNNNHKKNMTDPTENKGRAEHSSLS